MSITTVSDTELAQAAEIVQLKQEITALSITVENLEQLKQEVTALSVTVENLERLKSRPELTDAQILELWKQTYVQRGTSGIEFARAVLGASRG